MKIKSTVWKYVPKLFWVINNIHGLTSMAKFFIAVLSSIVKTPINSTRSTRVSLKL